MRVPLSTYEGLRTKNTYSICSPLTLYKPVRQRYNPRSVSTNFAFPITKYSEEPEERFLSTITSAPLKKEGAKPPFLAQRVDYHCVILHDLFLRSISVWFKKKERPFQMVEYTIQRRNSPTLTGPLCAERKLTGRGGWQTKELLQGLSVTILG